jgi:hypothetical protein
LTELQGQAIIPTRYKMLIRIDDEL